MNISDELEIIILDKTISLDFILLNEMLIQTEEFLSKGEDGSSVVFLDNNINRYAFSLLGNTVNIWYEAKGEPPDDRPIYEVSTDRFLQIMGVLNNIKNNYFVLIMLSSMTKEQKDNGSCSSTTKEVDMDDVHQVDIVGNKADVDLLNDVNNLYENFNNVFKNKI